MSSRSRRNFGEADFSDRWRYSALHPFWRQLAVLAVISMGLCSIAVLLTLLYYGQLANRENIDDLGKMPQRSVVYDRHGEVIGRLHGSNRILVSANDVSPFFIDALLAREDSRFFRHSGIDYLGVCRAALRNLKDRGLIQGASTITMQLAKNSYFGPEKTLHRKLLEIMMARRIERHYTKHEILTHYVNRIYFGAGLYGIERASQAYFQKAPADLDIGEAALLAGLIRAPSRYSPVRHYEDALRERDAVLDRMLEEKLATPEEVAAAKATRPAVYSVDLARLQESYALDAVRRDLDLFLEESDIEDGGFEIHTTLDLRLQTAAEAALETHLSALEGEPGFRHPTRSDFEGGGHNGAPASTDYIQGAVVVLDNATGAMIAVVGGRDFTHNKYNRALLARRQIGSAFKPFVYASAFDAGYMPGTLVSDSPIEPGEIPAGGNWSPRNSDGTYQGLQPLEWGLVRSRNTMSVRAGAGAGLEAVMAIARNLMLTAEVEPSPQLYIGNLGATLKALTSAYSVFPNGGILRRPFVIARIHKIGGGRLRATPVVEYPVFSAGTASLTSGILQKVMDEGTGATARSLGFSAPAGGKTGTTNDYTDAWFLGYTSRLSTGVWVGLDQPQTIIDQGYGSRLALPVWVDIMKNAETLGYPAGSLEPAIPYTKVELCRISGLLSTPSCRDAGHGYIEDLPFEKVPRASCGYHDSRLAKARPVVPRARPVEDVIRKIFDFFR